MCPINAMINDGEDLATWLACHGCALDYTRYSGGTCAGQQQQARSECRGMWQGAFEAPWEWWRRGVPADDVAN